MDEATNPIVAEGRADPVDPTRSALLDILSASATQWRKTELAAWLAGPYREATERAPESVRRQHALTPYTHSSGAPDDEQLREVLASARQMVMTLMHGTPRGDFEFAVEALEAGYIEQLEDTDGNHLFLPVDHARMALADRILSLLAADYLSHPADYEDRLSFCRCCAAASFSADTRVRGQCSTHPPNEIRVRRLPCPSVHRTLIGLGRLTA